MKIYKKGMAKKITKGLSLKEFECKCNNESCRGTMINSTLIKAYARFRELVNVKLTINSGYRCPEHNLAVGGMPLSRHIAGEAIDISLKTLDHLTQSDIEYAAKMSGFTFMKFYKSFVHLDVGEP